MEEWKVSIIHWGNGYCELQAKTDAGKFVIANSHEELLKKVKEYCGK